MRVSASVRSQSAREQLVRLGCAATVLDVRDAAAVEAWFEAIGPHDALLNNAAVLGPRRSLLETTPEDVREVLHTNVVGAFTVARAALRHLVPGGRMFHVSSYLGRHALPDYGAYCLSKFALEGLARVVACENPALLSVALDPGMVQTDMLRDARLGGPIDDATTAEAAAVRVLDLFATLPLETSGTTVSL